MKSHNNNLNAAADLIRNLDVALSNMTAAANTASNDAAKARRNAKAAGEVARRYGGGSKGGGSGRKNNKQRAVAADNNNNLLLEKKREKRNAARIAAEVRQRREHPYNNYSSSSPSRLLGSPTTRRLGTPSRIFVERDDKVGSGGCEEGEEGLLLDKTVAAIQFRANQLEEANNKKKRQVVHGYDNSANISNNANYYHAETEKVNTARITENIPVPVVEPTLEATTSLGSTYTEFEDAMEEEHNHYHYEGNENNMESVEGGSSIGQQPMMMGGDEVQMMADAEEDELKVQPVLQPPPTNNEYYNQQTSYYQSEDQAADSIDMGPQNFYKQEVQQNNNMVYNDFHQDENEQYYNEQQQTETEHREKQHQHASTPKKAKMSVVSTLPTPKHSIPPTPPRSQPTSTNRIEASHAEDVLTLSLELERLRSELATTTEQLTNATCENETLNVELTNIQSQCNLNNESTNAQLATLQQQLQNEQRKSKAAEEDAALALELAKDAQTTKEECEVWLSRSLEEIDLWKKKCLDMEQKLSSSKIMMEEGEEGGEEEKHVRFKDDCPPSPVVSEDGTFGLDDEDADIDNNASSPMIKSTPPQPPPPPPPTPSTPAVDGAWSTPEDSKHMGMMMFSPTTLLSSETTPSKEAAVATGRAFLHRMTTPSSLSSSSPYASRGSLSPHPRLQASELLKKSAETRRLLRERLTPGRNGKLPRPPATARINDDAKSSNPNNNTDDNAFASRQGAACKAVGKTIRESGARLKLNGKWWGGDNGATKLLTFGGSSTNSGEEGTIEELESMVKDYTANVEGTIGQQRTKIDELLAFCDHLEKEVMIM